MTHSKALEIAIRAAKLGAKEAFKYYNSSLEVENKKDNTVVTIADVNTEKIIKSFITSQIPDANFLGEETGGSYKTNESVWIIDPIDGTRAFSRGIDRWCILIALYEQGEFTTGVSYFPVTNQLLYAEKGYGAYLNEKKITVSAINKTQKAYLSYGSIRFFKDKEKLLQVIDLFESARSIEEPYAKLAVASGKLDAYLGAYDKVWDFAPFIPIVTEAGGKITSLTGKPLKLSDKGCIATNGRLHEEIIKIITKTS